MHRDGRTLFWLLMAATLASAGAAWIAIETGQEAVALTMGVPILFVSAVALWLALPLPGRLVITDQPELETDDLIFYLYGDPTTDPPRFIPRDYLLQLHVAAVNLGDRKAILASVVLEQFLDIGGRPIALPGAPERLTAVNWVQRSGYINGQRHSENLNQLPPYVLDSNDAVTLRFRCRRGISWSFPSLHELQKTHDALVRPITKARGHFSWREGSKVHCSEFTVPVKVKQQQEYVKAIHDLTQGFTTLPQDVRPEHISTD